MEGTMNKRDGRMRPALLISLADAFAAYLVYSFLDSLFLQEVSFIQACKDPSTILFAVIVFIINFVFIYRKKKSVKNKSEIRKRYEIKLD